jgi:hypothetical protein
MRTVYFALMLLLPAYSFAAGLEETFQALQNQKLAQDQANNAGQATEPTKAANDAIEFVDIMKKAVAFAPEAAGIVGPIPQASELEAGSVYVHNQYDSVETSGSVIFDNWSAYRSGPLEYANGDEVCLAKKMTYIHTYAWSRKSDGNTLVVRCYRKDDKGTLTSRSFKISYGVKSLEVDEIENNLDGAIGTRTTLNKKGKFVY